MQRFVKNVLISLLIFVPTVLSLFLCFALLYTLYLLCINWDMDVHNMYKDKRVIYRRVPCLIKNYAMKTYGGVEV